MIKHRALVIAIPAARRGDVNGGSLRVDDIMATLGRAHLTADIVANIPRGRQRWCTGVAVSYASAGHLPALAQTTERLWLDAMDSWLLVNGSGLRRGQLSYAARGVRDAMRLLRAPRVDLATWITDHDRRQDGRTVRARRRLVLPPAPIDTRLGAPGPGRIVIVGDWQYPPNREGLLAFVRDVVPGLTATLHVYGRCAPPLQLPGVHVHGYVADLSDAYRHGDVHVCPVTFGAGIKRKVLQPLLAGLPVVTTPAGAHGLCPHPLLSVAADVTAMAALLSRRVGAAPQVPPPTLAELLQLDESAQVRDWLASCGCNI